MGEEAALAHTHGRCQPADRESVDALDRGELSGFTQDRLAAAFAVAAPPAWARRPITDLCVTHHGQLSTIGRTLSRKACTNDRTNYREEVTMTYASHPNAHARALSVLGPIGRLGRMAAEHRGRVFV